MSNTESGKSTIRPLDVLMNSKGKEIVVELKGDRVYKGKLKAFDIHVNVVLFEAKEVSTETEEELGNIFIRGDTILMIKGI